MKLTVVGTGEAFDSGLGNNAFLLHGARTPTVLFDCGYQIPERLWARNLHRKLDAVYLTHTHADHAFGLAPLLSRYWEEGRTRPLTIVGHRGMRSYVTKVMDLAYPGLRALFPYAIEFVAVRPNAATTWRGLQLRCARSEHSVTNLSVRIDGASGRSFAVSGDGALNAATGALYRGVGILCHEVFRLRPPCPNHMSLAELRAYAKDSGIGRVVVSHHSRSQKARIRRAVERIDEPGPTWIAADPGAVLDV